MFYFVFVFFDDTTMTCSFLLAFASTMENLWIWLKWLCFDSPFPDFDVLLFICLKQRFIRTWLANPSNIISSPVSSFHIKYSLLISIVQIIPLNLSKHGIFLLFFEMPLIFFIYLPIVLLSQSLSTIQNLFSFSFIFVFQFLFIILDDSAYQLKLFFA